jgi:phenylacetate-CoA ligase
MIFTQWEQPPPAFYQKLGIFPTKFISPFEDVAWQLEQLKAYNPQTIFTLPSHALTLAKEIHEMDIQGIRPSLIFSQGELLDDHTRKVVTEAFDADVFNSYGAVEVGRIASECRDHSFHTQGDLNLVEVTRGDDVLAPREEGEVTVTNLHNYVMPFIRYNLQDLGYLLEDTCSCGCHFPQMDLTLGRTRDYIQLLDGRTVPAFEATIFLQELTGIKQFQVIQEKRDRLVVQIVRGRDFQDTVMETIQSGFHRNLGDDIAIDVVLVDAIPRERTGKLFSFKTKLPSPKLFSEVEDAR